MKLARYVGEGRIEICDEPKPLCPPGGLLVRTLASGLCSGELMSWYMDLKIPHVLGHEVCGVVEESEDRRFPVGAQVFVHHHAPCMKCDLCRAGKYVHCAQWKATKLIPGGMAEYFAVAKENLSDAFRVEDMRPVDAALIEPLACVAKSLARGGAVGRLAVIGLGSMGLMHMLALGERAVGYDLSERRLAWAKGLGLDARGPEAAEPADLIFVCPGSEAAIHSAISMANPGGTIVLFAPTPPGKSAIDLNTAYFKDLKLVSSYSCGPEDTRVAAEWLRAGRIRSEQVVSEFLGIDGLPAAYQAMKAGDILKAMVLFQ